MKIIMTRSTAKKLKFRSAIIAGISFGMLIATLLLGFAFHPEVFMYTYGEHKTFQEVAPALPGLIMILMAATLISFGIYNFFDMKIEEYTKK